MTTKRTPRRRLERGEELDANKVADELENRGMVRRRPVVPVIVPLGPLEDFPDDPTTNPERARAVIAAAGITPIAEATDGRLCGECRDTLCRRCEAFLDSGDLPGGLCTVCRPNDLEGGTCG